MTNRTIKVIAGKKPYFRQIIGKRAKSAHIPGTDGR